MLSLRFLRATVPALAALAFGCGAVAGDDRADASDASLADDTASTPDEAGVDGEIFFGDSNVLPARPLVCPAAEPSAGAACDDRSNLCEYGSSNNVLCNRLYRCLQKRWYVEQDAIRCPVVESCPADVDAGSCVSSYTRCEYPDAGHDCVCSSCGAGPPGPHSADPQWRCFDPGAGCPLARPNIGTACAIADGGRCNYSAGGCCTGVMLACEDGVWTGYVTEPCP